MNRQKSIVEEMLARVGVQINGSKPWDIRVNDDRMYGRILRDKNLGLGESVHGWMVGLSSAGRLHLSHP